MQGRILRVVLSLCQIRHGFRESPTMNKGISRSSQCPAHIVIPRSGNINKHVSATLNNAISRERWEQSNKVVLTRLQFHGSHRQSPTAFPSLQRGTMAAAFFGMPGQPDQPTQPAPPLTEFARKYGIANFSQFRSGLTPTAPVFPTLGPPNPFPIEAYQKQILWDFTSEELDRIDCLPTRDLKPGNLQNGIIPLLRRESWQQAVGTPRFTNHRPENFYKMINGNGYWTMGNDEAWNVMEPSLRLASRMMMSSHLIPWVR